MAKYEVYLIMGLRHCRYEGEYAPEVLDAWDEYSLQENPRGYAERLKEFKSRSDFARVEEAIVEIDHEVVGRLFALPRIAGRLKTPDPREEIGEIRQVDFDALTASVRVENSYLAVTWSLLHQDLKTPYIGQAVKVTFDENEEISKVEPV